MKTRTWIGRASLAAVALILVAGVQARTWTSADGAKTFDGELKTYDPATGMVDVTLPNGKAMKFAQDKLSAADIAFLKEQGKVEAPAAGKSSAGKIDADPKNLFKPHDGKPADMGKPVQVFILLGQSNMVGAGKTAGLETAVKQNKKYPYLLDEAGNWIVRQDVRNVRVMCSGAGPWKMYQNEWMTVSGNSIGPELGLGYPLGNAIAAPVMILKSCIGNRALSWDLLPPGAEGYAGNPDPPRKPKDVKNPLSMGGSGNGHYGGNPETYMNVGEAMGKAMVELLSAK